MKSVISCTLINFLSCWYIYAHDVNNVDVIKCSILKTMDLLRKLDQIVEIKREFLCME
jgi:hypothetical protein